MFWRKFMRGNTGHQAVVVGVLHGVLIPFALLYHAVKDFFLPILHYFDQFCMVLVFLDVLQDFNPRAAAGSFAFLIISQISIKNTRKINRIFLRLIVFYAYFAAMVEIPCSARTTADDHFSAYLVPLPRPSIFTMPFSAIFFNSCVVFDLLNATCGAMSPMDFSTVLLRR